jgi:hypothetical protein
MADLACIFFTKLATKDNAVYNYFVDMFSELTQESPLDGGVIEKEVVDCIQRRMEGSKFRAPSAFLEDMPLLQS